MINDLRALARVLGGDVVGGQVLIPGPGHSSADRSLAVRPSHQSPHGFITHSHCGDDWRACRDHIMARLGYQVGAVATQQPPRTVPPIASGDGVAQAKALWRAAVSPRSTIVEDYLRSRSLVLPDAAGDVVRFHAACPWRDDKGDMIRVPAMLTAFRGIVGDEIVAIHRTALTVDGVKIGRRMLGPVGGAAIKINEDAAVTCGLTIGEGFETCLAGASLGFRPVWALGSAGAIGAFPVLAGIDALTILAEDDATGANARAIEQCGNRWSDAGREVLVVKPVVGGDINDALLGRIAA